MSERLRAMFGYVRLLCSPLLGIVGTAMLLHSLAAPCYWGMQFQIARHLVMVGSKRLWVAHGGAVLLGNAIAGC